MSRSNQASPHGRVSLHGPTGHVLRAKSGMPSGLDDGGSVDSDFSALVGMSTPARAACHSRAHGTVRASSAHVVNRLLPWCYQGPVLAC